MTEAKCTNCGEAIAMIDLLRSRGGIESNSGLNGDLSDHDLAVLSDWASENASTVSNPDWKRPYALLREGADLLLRRRARARQFIPDLDPKEKASNVNRAGSEGDDPRLANRKLPCGCTNECEGHASQSAPLPGRRIIQESPIGKAPKRR